MRDYVVADNGLHSRIHTCIHMQITVPCKFRLVLGEGKKAIVLSAGLSSG